MRFIAYLSVASLGLLSVTASPALQARESSTTDLSAVMSQFKANAGPVVSKLQKQLNSGNPNNTEVDSDMGQLTQYIKQANGQLGATPSNEKRQLPDPLAPASSGLDLASSIVGLVDSIIGLAGTASAGSDDEGEEDPLSGLGI